jgi:predicted CXXCH cytochrome family protein
VGCTDCHDAHSQKALFEDPDALCVNCHKDSMGPYLEDIHIKQGIGCVDCHALVIPPETPPQDGIVPTGHSFTITPATCVACHTSSLHAGFSLPGYNRGEEGAGEKDSAALEPLPIAAHIQSPQERIQSLETQAQTLQAALASRNLSILFQGAVVGLVLGSSTAWIVASNVRQRRQEEDEGRDERE